MNTAREYDAIARHIEASDLPRKAQKLDGLRRAQINKVRLTILGDMIMRDGITIDPSELEDGYWL